MFTPVLDLEVLIRATVLRFSDITGPDTGNGTKWDGIAGLDSTLVSAANLIITDPNNLITTLNVLSDIIAADPITGDIIFDDITGAWVDGYYNVEYNIWMVGTAITQVEDYSATVQGTIKIHSTAHLVQTGMKVTISGGAGIYTGFYDATYIDADHYYVTAIYSITDTGTSTPCYSNTITPFVFSNIEMAIDKMYAIFAEMDESVEGDEYLRHIELCNGLLNTLKSTIVTSTSVRVNNIYGRITRILDFNNIEIVY